MMARLIRQPKNLQFCTAGSVALGWGPAAATAAPASVAPGREVAGSALGKLRLNQASRGSIRLGAVAGGVPGPNYYVDLFIDLVDDVFEHGYVLSQHVDFS
jgi:hypothetical protein